MANSLDTYVTPITFIVEGLGVGKSIETNEWLFGKIKYSFETHLHSVNDIPVYEKSVGKQTDCPIIDYGKTKFFCEGQFVMLGFAGDPEFSKIFLGVCEYDDGFCCYVIRKGKRKIILKHLCNFIEQEIYTYAQYDIYLTVGGYLFDNPNFDALPKKEIDGDLPF